jgi:hypothetical protein
MRESIVLINKVQADQKAVLDELRQKLRERPIPQRGGRKP